MLVFNVVYHVYTLIYKNFSSESKLFYLLHAAVWTRQQTTVGHLAVATVQIPATLGKIGTCFNNTKYFLQDTWIDFLTYLLSEVGDWIALTGVWLELEAQILFHCSFCVRLLGKHWSVRGARQMHHPDYWRYSHYSHYSHTIDPTSHSSQLFLITAAAYLRWMPSCRSGEKSE